MEKVEYLASLILHDNFKIDLLAECNNELRIIKTKSDIDGLLLKKYNVKHEEETDELAGVDLNNIHCDKYKLDKLANDRFVTSLSSSS